MRIMKVETQTHRKRKEAEWVTHKVDGSMPSLPAGAKVAQRKRIKPCVSVRLCSITEIF